MFVADGETIDAPLAATWHGKRFSDPATIQEMANIIHRAYGEVAASNWIRYLELAWLDIDGDGLEEAVTVASGPDSACDFDLVVFAFNANGAIRNAGKIVERKHRSKCFGIPFDVGDWWTFMVVPWPASDRGLALLLEVGTGGGDNFEHYVLPLDGLLDESKASAVFVASFFARSDMPSE